MKTILKRRKHLIAIIGVIAVLILAFTSYRLFWNNKTPFREQGKDLTWYGIDVDFNPKVGRIDCQQRTYYINTEDTQIQTYTSTFILIPLNTKIRLYSLRREMDRAYPNGFSPGFIEFDKIELDGSPASYTIQGYSDDILMISLDKTLKPGDRADIWLEYSVKLPNSPGRFGYWANTYNLGNWYPILCVYDERGWNLEPYYSLGDPFYSDVSNYKVRINALRILYCCYRGLH